MTLYPDVDNSIPIPPAHDKEARLDMREKARAAANAVNLLEKHGLDPRMDDESEMFIAGRRVTEYAEDPDAASKEFSAKAIARTPPAALQLTHKILEDYGHSIVQSSVQIRHMVVNKLVQETENPDPRIRVKALELLGKMSDVGLFTERSEVTVTHQSTADLREQLKARLNRLKDVTPAGAIEDAEVVEDGDD